MTVIPLTEMLLRSRPLPKHGEGGSKQIRGQVLVVGGSRPVPGAALLAGTAALRAGAGILQIATVRSVAVALAVAMPEAMVIGLDETAEGDIAPSAADRVADLAATCDTVLIGPGMLDEICASQIVARTLDAAPQTPVVLDAAAFTGLKQFDRFAFHGSRLAVTPHAGEMAKFLGVDREEIENDMLAAGRRAAEKTNGVVAMKGAETHILGAQGAWLSRHGSIALATSGSGDALAGLLAGLLARGADPVTATLWAVYVHAEAGRRLELQYGKFGALARELPAQFPTIMNELNGDR
jgi:ADP-dependent NAD(P)H-hydrate dehydratase